ncbi:hypothetical protein [Pelolinea submarina]|uniref:Uncharacterized protein n=1 Tax=Pelolinea submarina TaxID=913107 RepID=A0A347ZUA7_9CHLR|nr:hypothetical protein [Pelolinea submarina]REG10527.1 hypothetical protein DFR64_0386 [Pelolinea submarina]BBB48888.1 hypothetical protein Pelsub_P2119 [Pelolinea submarina]
MKNILFKIIQVVLIILTFLMVVFYIQTVYSFAEKLQTTILQVVIGILALAFLIASYLFGPGIVEIFIIDPTNDHDLKLPLIFTFALSIPLLIYFLFFKGVDFSGIDPKLDLISKVQLEGFWLSFWKSFYAIPIFFLISRFFNNSGDKIESGYQWALGNSNRGYRSATQKEVWNHNNRSSRSWDENQTLKTNIIFAVLVLGFYALTFLEDSPASTHIFRFIALVLAGGFSAGYLFSLSKAVGYDLETNDFDKVDESPIPFFASAISIIAMLGMGLILLISYLIKKELLFSLNYLWIPMMIAPLAWLLKNILTNKKEQRVREDSLVPYYQDNPDVLSLWAFNLYQEIEKGDSTYTFLKDSQLYRQVAERCNDLISQRSYILYSDDLMEQTEALMVALVRGESISIVVPAVYDQRTFLIETAQKLYFYYVNEMNRPIHHEIQEKISGY